MERDAGMVGEVDEGGGVPGEAVLDGTALLSHLDAPDPFWKVATRALLNDPFALDAVGIALEIERPIAEVRQHGRGHRVVVAGQVGLRDAGGEQQLAGTRDLQASGPSLDGDAHEPE